MPGKNIIHQATVKSCDDEASESMRPHDGVVCGMPTPRKERAGIMVTNTPTKTTATSMIGAQLKRLATWISRLVESSESTAQPAGVNQANLRRIAAATGGQWIDAANPATWPTAETVSTDTVPQVRTFDLWNTFTLLLLLLAVLGTDWALRVVKGFV